MLTTEQAKGIIDAYQHKGFTAAGQLAVRFIREGANHKLCELLIACDSELSAIAHGRPPSDKQRLRDLSLACRSYYETNAEGCTSQSSAPVLVAREQFNSMVDALETIQIMAAACDLYDIANVARDAMTNTRSP